MIFVGIDPGLEGAVAWIDGERKTIEVRDCPLESKGVYDYMAMRDLLSNIVSVRMVVTMEKVGAMPTDARRAAFTFGIGYGAWLALVNGVLRVRPNLVTPRSWKYSMLAGVANNKKMEAKVCEQIFKGYQISRMLYGPMGGLRDGRVDALLLAEHGRRHFKLGGSHG